MKEEPIVTPKPYELLGLMTRDVLFGDGYSSKNSAINEQNTDAHIQTMYYSALANLYVQSTLPGEIKIMDGDMPPRLSLALDRSYVDFNAAENWLSKNGKLIEKSRSKHLYEEVVELGKGMVIDTEMFLGVKK